VEQLQQEKSDGDAALRKAQEEAEALRTDVGRSNFRLGDLQETVERLQASPAVLVYGAHCTYQDENGGAAD
jgi:hypothetical protein